MPRFFLKTVSILTLAALTACSDSKEYSNPSFGPSLGFKESSIVAMRAAKISTVNARNTERYQEQPDQPVKSVAQEPVSTFSIDVDTGSYANVRRFLNSGKQPPKDAVRIEEIVNYFPYNYPLPTDGRPFAVHTETIDSPWQPEAKLIKIGIQAQDTAKKDLPPANLVFLVDVSGSMNAENKLPLVQETLRILTRQLRPQDKVTLITYASGEDLVLPPTSGANKETILNAIDKLRAGGATDGESALQMAYEQAQKAFVPNGINRILLATDGDFNVGVSDTETLKSMVAEKRKKRRFTQHARIRYRQLQRRHDGTNCRCRRRQLQLHRQRKRSEKSSAAATDFHAGHRCARCQNPSRIQSCHCQRIPLGRLHQPHLTQ